MRKNENYKVSELHEKWLDDSNCLIGFTITYANGNIENQLRNCDKKTHDKALKELMKIRDKYLAK